MHRCCMRHRTGQMPTAQIVPMSPSYFAIGSMHGNAPMRCFPRLTRKPLSNRTETIISRSSIVRSRRRMFCGVFYHSAHTSPYLSQPPSATRLCAVSARRRNSTKGNTAILRRNRLNKSGIGGIQSGIRVWSPHFHRHAHSQGARCTRRVRGFLPPSTARRVRQYS